LAPSRFIHPSYLLAAFAVALPLGAQLSGLVAHLQLFLIPLILFIIVVFTGADVFACWKAAERRRGDWLRALGPGLLGGFVAFGGLLLSARATLGVPYYVRADAQAPIDSIEGWRSAHGQYPPVESRDPEFPEELGRTLRGCFYRPVAGSYSLTCPGALFTKCTYDARNKRWSGWD
jgi:hypothetical protein